MPAIGDHLGQPPAGHSCPGTWTLDDLGNRAAMIEIRCAELAADDRQYMTIRMTHSRDRLTVDLGPFDGIVYITNRTVTVRDNYGRMLYSNAPEFQQ